MIVNRDWGSGRRNPRGALATPQVVSNGESGGLQIDSLGAPSVRLNVERHALSLRQRTHACRFDSGCMNEHGLAAALRSDESKALRGVEKFYRSDRHDFS